MEAKLDIYDEQFHFSPGAAGVLVGHPFDTVKVGFYLQFIQTQQYFFLLYRKTSQYIIFLKASTLCSVIIMLTDFSSAYNLKPIFSVIQQD